MSLLTLTNLQIKSFSKIDLEELRVPWKISCCMRNVVTLLNKVLTYLLTNTKTELRLEVQVTRNCFAWIPTLTGARP